MSESFIDGMVLKNQSRQREKAEKLQQSVVPNRLAQMSKSKIHFEFQISAVVRLDARPADASSGEKRGRFETSTLGGFIFN
jgi:hypothetical protein